MPIIPPSPPVLFAGIPNPLTWKDYRDASVVLNCDLKAIKAVCMVETADRPRGYDDQKRPIILFERHLFHRFTGGKYDDKTDISSPTPGGYGHNSDQYPKLIRAMALNKSAALQSASWGLFQILGQNFGVVGFPDVDSFVNAMVFGGESAHLKAFIRFVQANHLDKALRGLDWDLFAAGYNGPAYKENHYAEKLASAYRSA